MPAVQEAGSRRKSPSTGKTGSALRPRRGEAEQGAAMFVGSGPTGDPRPLAAWEGRDAELCGNALVFHSRPLEVWFGNSALSGTAAKTELTCFTLSLLFKYRLSFSYWVQFLRMTGSLLLGSIFLSAWKEESNISLPQMTNPITTQTFR